MSAQIRGQRHPPKSSGPRRPRRSRDARENEAGSRAAYRDLPRLIPSFPSPLACTRKKIRGKKETQPAAASEQARANSGGRRISPARSRPPPRSSANKTRGLPLFPVRLSACQIEPEIRGLKPAGPCLLRPLRHTTGAGSLCLQPSPAAAGRGAQTSKMDRAKRLLIYVAAAHMLLSMMAMVIESRKRKRDGRRVGITYGPIEERDRMRIDYLNSKIWINDTVCVSMLRLSREKFFRFSKVFRDRGLLEDTIHMCVEQQVAMFLAVRGLP